MKRGEIYYADLPAVVGSEQSGFRPVLIIQNDIGNKYSPTIIVAVITSQIKKANLPTHVEIELEKPSIVLLEQIKTLDKRRLRGYLCSLSEEKMREIDRALQISLELVS